MHEAAAFVRLAKSLGVNGIKFYTLHEYEGLNWKIETEDGDFDYTDEWTSKCKAAFNKHLREAVDEANRLNLVIEFPGYYLETETIS